ncbi:unnamed protein product [Notodromas monacha]|uniref:DNA polymerase V n=1 Tax=Notodromas monacha TaxID=399045 RepID=A0A7R9BE64_9CRUS|nr:unnamed protein product [Notodromas monacha]CAG0913736.1 unnamed protein product [Notodromas monacha]
MPVPVEMEDDDAVEKVDVTTGLLDNLRKISQEKTWIRASADIVRHFWSKSATEIQDDGVDSKEDEKDFEYVLKRLLSGLTSCEYRMQYYTCLRELLTIRSKSLVYLTSLTSDIFRAQQNSTKRETGNANLAKLLLANLYCDLATSITQQECIALVDIYCELMQEKAFIVSKATQYLIRLLDLTPTSSTKVWKHVTSKVSQFVEKRAKIFEFLGLAMFLEHNGMEVRNVDCFVDSNTFFHHTALPAIVEAFLFQANSYPRIHFLIPRIVQILGERNLLGKFVKLLGLKQGTTRTHIGMFLSVVTFSVPYMKDETIVRQILTPAVIELLLKVGKFEKIPEKFKNKEKMKFIVGEQKPVKKLMTTLLDHLCEKSTDLESTKCAVLECFLSCEAAFHFDKVMGTKTMEALLLASRECQTVETVAKKCLVSFVEKPQTSSEYLEDENEESGEISRVPSFAKKISAASLLASCVLHPAFRNSPLRTNCIKHLVALPIFRPKSQDSRAFVKVFKREHPWASDKCADDLNKELITFIEKIVLHTSWKTKFRGDLSEMVAIVREVVDIIDYFLKEKSVISSWKLLESRRDDWTKCSAALHDCIGRINKTESPDPDQVFFLVLSLNMFRLITDPIGVSLTDDLLESRKRASGENAEGPHWCEVLIGIMLEMLSAEKRIYREFLSSTVSYLAPFVTRDCVDIILDHVDVPEDSEGMFTVIDEDGESDVEESDGDVEDEKELDNGFRDHVKSALGDMAAETDLESVNISDLGTEEMEGLDRALAKAFGNTKAGVKNLRKDSKRAESLEMNLKIKAIDFVERILFNDKSVVEYDLFLLIVKRLANAVRTGLKDLSSYKYLTERICSVFVKLSKNLMEDNKIVPTRVDGLEDVFELMGDIIKKSQCPTVGIAVGNMWMRLLLDATRCKHFGKQMGNKHVEKFIDLLSDFSRGTSKVNVNVFANIVRYPWPGHVQFLESVAEKVFEESTKEHKKVGLCGVIRKNIKFLISRQSKSDVATVLSMWMSKLWEELKAQRNDDAKTRWLKECCGLLNLLCKLANNTELSVDPKVETKEALAVLAKNVNLKKRPDVMGAFKCLANTCGLPPSELPTFSPSTMKRKAAEENKLTDEEPLKKRKKNTFARAQKKREENERRNARFNDGQLGAVNFSSLVQKDYGADEKK